MTSTPTSFVYQFESAADANASWTFDPMHFPDPLPRLTQDAVRAVQGEVGGSRIIFVNGYAYNLFGQMPMDAEVFRKGAVRIWENDYAPSIADFCRDARERDYAAMAAAEIVAALPGIFARAGKSMTFTFTVIPGYMPQTIALLDYSEEHLGSDGPVLVGALLQSGTNGTANAAAGLAELTELALTLPAVAGALRDGNLAGLAQVEGGPLFLERLRAYVAEYGWRAQEWGAVHVPTWAEDHARPLSLIGGYLRDEETSPRAALARAAAGREEAERTVRERLTGEADERFWQLLEAASAHVPMSENRAFWQLTIIGSLRPALMALGQKLTVAGMIDRPEDVFHLSLGEIDEALGQPPANRGAVVRERETQLSEWRALRPPPFVGQPPSGEGMPAAAVSMFTRFFGAEVAQPKDPDIIKGNPASKGVVRGTARVVRDLADAGRLQPGEILVCITTAPPWTPLFAIASAVVTDTGGVLSHSAICAREFGIPCVAGTRVATATIPDGATITVDGAAGTVTIEA